MLNQKSSVMKVKKKHKSYWDHLKTGMKKKHKRIIRNFDERITPIEQVEKDEPIEPIKPITEQPEFGFM